MQFAAERQAEEDRVRELAVSLGQLPVDSRSKPGLRYLMVRTPAGRWEHADPFICGGYLNRGYCQHQDDARDLEVRIMSESGTEIVVYNNPLALTERVSVDDIIHDFKAVGEWRYAFRRNGQDIEGISADGVRDGVRELARKGEVIRTLECKLDHQNEREAFFIARAGRYAISPDGQEILLDTTLRGKRIDKYELHGSDDQYGRWKKGDEYLNEAWFEHGVTKACRNAEEALMPEALKQWMIAQARGGETQTRSTGRGPQRPWQTPTQRADEPPTFSQEMMAEFKGRVDGIALRGTAARDEAVKAVKETYAYALNERGRLSINLLRQSDHEGVMTILKGFEGGPASIDAISPEGEAQQASMPV